ncbi:GGDEF domain-containing protein [Methylobacterium sp. Leaf466]|uniref:GGDEF domain-containing protein n=1 Tax=Methylobacterium sp. Leaf466 TaxID=1736386 RepID=UPI000700C472|nr:GGDEF domain-containing protein [Methylobacterium sp. Leaf466]KQT80806.1 dethiobiotin synthetase [Methylobacterium sp. Leaf466]
MQLDAPTLLVATALLTGMVGSLFLLSWSQARTVRALAIWGIAHVVGAFASCLLALRGTIPDWTSIGIGNAVMIGAYGLIRSGTLAFEGRPLRFWQAGTGVGVWLAACLVPPFYESAPARVMLASLLAGGFCWLSAVDVWRGRAEPLVSRYPAVVILGAYAALYWLRIPLAMIQPAPPPGFNPLQSPWLAWVCLAAMLFSLALAFVFMALTKERAELLQRRAADTDPLTGIASRRAFVTRAEAVLAGTDRPAALLLFDLDHFKRINDADGHAVGDGVLVGFCHTVQALLPGEAVFGRMGGEEFACLLRDREAAAALDTADLIRRAVERLSLESLPHLSVTVSIGVATTRTQGRALERDLDALLRRADQALYEAKRRGRNRVEPALPDRTPQPRAAAFPERGTVRPDVPGLRLNGQGHRT